MITHVIITCDISHDQYVCDMSYDKCVIAHMISMCDMSRDQYLCSCYQLVCKGTGEGSPQRMDQLYSTDFRSLVQPRVLVSIND